MRHGSCVNNTTSILDASPSARTRHRQKSASDGVQTLGNISSTSFVWHTTALMTLRESQNGELTNAHRRTSSTLRSYQPILTTYWNAWAKNAAKVPERSQSIPTMEVQQRDITEIYSRNVIRKGLAQSTIRATFRYLTIAKIANMSNTTRHELHG